jgi:hypothetical protein
MLAKVSLTKRNFIICFIGIPYPNLNKSQRVNGVSLQDMQQQQLKER